MSDNRREFERELILRLNDAAAGPAPGALERARLAIARTPQRTGWRVWLMSAFGSVQWTQAGAMAAVAAAALVVGMAIGRFGLPVGHGPFTTPTTSPSPTPSLSASASQWTGPVRPDLVDLPVLPVGTDPGDAAISWVDITRVRVSPGSGQIHWYIELADSPPPPDEQDRAGTIISYGLVIETTGDGVADYVVGISNDAPRQGNLRVWVTDLATGQSDERTEGPYGYPVEFAYPGLVAPGEDTRLMVFTFLGSSMPPGIDETSRFYAWASVANGDEVVAWDYAPDAGWIR